MTASELGIEGDRSVVPNLYLADGTLNVEAVRYYRHLHRMSQEQLAEFLGLHRNTVHHFETGRRKPSDATVRLLDAFVRATHALLIRYHGVIPPQERFSNWWDLTETERKERVVEVMAETDRRLQEREKEIEQLQVQVVELQAQNARLKRLHHNHIERMEQKLATALEQLKQDA